MEMTPDPGDAGVSEDADEFAETAGSSYSDDVDARAAGLLEVREA